MSELLTLEEAAEKLRLKPTALYELTRARTRSRHVHPIPVVRIGSRLRFRVADLEKWLELLAQEAA